MASQTITPSSRRTALPSRPAKELNTSPGQPRQENIRENIQARTESNAPQTAANTESDAARVAAPGGLGPQLPGGDAASPHGDAEVGVSANPGRFGQICSNCGTNSTPLWRRSPQGATICNACGLYLKARNTDRPTNLKRPPTVVANAPRQTPVKLSPRATSVHPSAAGAIYVAADQTPSGTCPGGGKCNGTGGAEGCGGCPAYNNRVSKSASLGLVGCQSVPSSAAAQPEGGVDDPAAPIDVGALRMPTPGTTVVIACHHCSTTVTPLWRRDDAGHTVCNACGLFQKLHGYHRPSNMTKSIIKRRKRVIPVAGGSPEAEDGREITASPSPSPEAERGSLNPDGSVNLGSRRREEQARTLVPETVLRQNRNTSPMSGDLGQYQYRSSTHNRQLEHHGSKNSHQLGVPESLRDENRLAPLTSLSVQDGRQSSLSPASFLSPSRKRSISNVDSEPATAPEAGDSKRLSSISSILNPRGGENSHDSAMLSARSPASTAASAPSPGTLSSSGVAITPPPFAPAQLSSREPGAEAKSKAERRAALAREAERMREMLAAKERELAEFDGV